MHVLSCIRVFATARMAANFIKKENGLSKPSLLKKFSNETTGGKSGVRSMCIKRQLRVDGELC